MRIKKATGTTVVDSAAESEFIWLFATLCTVSRCDNLNAALKVSELRLEPGLAVGIMWI